MVCCGFRHQQKLDWTRLDHGQDQGLDHGLHHRPNKKGFEKFKKKNIYIYIYITVFKIMINKNRIEKLKH